MNFVINLVDVELDNVEVIGFDDVVDEDEI